MVGYGWTVGSGAGQCNKCEAGQYDSGTESVDGNSRTHIEMLMDDENPVLHYDSYVCALRVACSSPRRARLLVCRRPMHACRVRPAVRTRLKAELILVRYAE